MADFSDIQDHWAKECIEKLADAEIISGYEDGTFKPDAPVTRAEFAAMLNKAFPNLLEIREGREFTDVAKDYWAYEVINKAYRTGFLSGYQDQTFKPEQNIPRVQALVSLANGLKYGLTQPIAKTLEETFSDAQDIPDYAQKPIAAGTENSLVVNYPDVKFIKPNELATRGEITTFLSQALLTANETSPVPDEYIAKAPKVEQSEGELRGVWLTNIDSDVLFSDTAVTAAINNLADFKFNTLYPVVWNGGYTLYPSQVLERVIGVSVHPEPGLQNRDVLQEIITQAQAKGMSVLPWFEFGLMAPQDTQFIQSRPHWITSDKDGMPFVQEGDQYRVWLNPFHPQVQQFMLDLIVEVITNYDVDGIQFDDHFGLPVELGYDPFTTQLYQREHEGKNPPTDPEDPDWVSWRAQKLTDFMMRVFWVVKEHQPDCTISLAPNTKEYAYSKFLQDWHSWEQFGYIEELVLQVYRDELENFTSELEHPEILSAKGHIPVGIGILTGLKDKPVALSSVKEQVEAVRQRKFAGTSFFFYETLKSLAETEDGKNTLQALFPEVIERPKIVTASIPSISIPDVPGLE